ncbi:putative RNA recognition motif domain, U2 snRNP auxilliary factor, large subunit, splicing factor [Septoria linicola]|nr:putative RNA recognition motif domain, U2 snRNP auxilliary factor, large subunit, splicing factor [Septoria linicola]
MSDRRMQSGRDDRRRDHRRDEDRRDSRRSRSPHHRRREGGGGGPEVDSYSSSRGYREREREERYNGGGGGRDRGDDREWGRDRGSARRDARRDDGGGRRRDDRRGGDREDLFADRRGGGRRDDRDARGPRGGRDGGDDRRERGQDRDDMKQLERQIKRESASPAPKKPREPTPDLTDVVGVLERKRRLTQWDIKPTGYDNVTAEQAKLSGMFPLPGAPRQQPMDPAKLQAFMNQPGNQASSSALKPSSARQSKRVLVYNLPASANDESIVDFFNLQLNGLNVTRGADPCISAQTSKDHTYALVEFKTPEDATNAMALDGINMDPNSMDTNGDANGAAKGLQIKRPRDYIVPNVTDDTQNEAGLLSNIVPDTQNKISITNLPAFLGEEQVQELLMSFGELKNFILVKHQSSGDSRGIAFCEYKDPTVTKVAVDSLNGMELGDAAMRVKLASIGIQQVSSEMSVNAMSLMAGAKSDDAENGRVLALMNMITPEELMDPDDADEILEDVKEECAKYGPLLDVKMPRPTGGSRQSNGVGKIYLKYESPEHAAKALAALAGRKFADRTVVVTYFGEEYFDVNAW